MPFRLPACRKPHYGGAGCHLGDTEADGGACGRCREASGDNECSSNCEITHSNREYPRETFLATIARRRDWLGAPIYRYALGLFEDDTEM